MQSQLEYIVDRIASQNLLHAKKLRKNLSNQNESFFIRADDFLKRYIKFLENDHKTLDYSINCYLQMLADVNYEAVQFLKTGEYSSKSFKEVNQRVYNNPKVMEYYMHGLLLSQFLWTHHYEILLYFNKIINSHKSLINNYLEVGGGHGLYISEAINIIRDNAQFDLVDISKSSLDISGKLILNNKVAFIHSDIFEYSPKIKYDFISMGEVLEHVENPVKLLMKLHSLLKDTGKLFITTPTNAPAIDHIYLFQNAADIRKVITESEFQIEQELCIFSEDLPPEIAEKNKISMMFAALLSK
jgi:2-polyprenyl-3-methyl-5-hydroxy-6-metoxy-1,4-benzoquinol methylase